MERLLVIATLAPGKAEEAAALIGSGPPFDLEESGLHAHGVYLSGREVVFTFEGVSVQRTVSSLVNDPRNSGMLAPWVALTDGPPRLLLEQFHWSAGRKRSAA